MTEITGVNESKIDVAKQGEAESKKTIFQEIKEKAEKVWSKFKESMGKLWGKTDEKLEPVNKKAEKISEKTKTESVREYFKKQTESFKDGIRVRSYDIYGGFYDIGAAVSQAKAAFWHNFMGGKFVTYLGENQRNVKTRKEKAKEYRGKAKNIRESLKKSKVNHE